MKYHVDDIPTGEWLSTAEAAEHAGIPITRSTGFASALLLRWENEGLIEKRIQFTKNGITPHRYFWRRTA